MKAVEPRHAHDETSHATARLELFGAALLFSTGGAAVKACSLTGWQIAALRSLIAAVTVWCLVPRSRRGWKKPLLPVAVAYAVTLILFVLANKMTTAANTIFLQSTAPLYVLLLSPRLLGERVRASDVAWLALAACGLALLVGGGQPASRTAPDPLRGNVAAVLSGLTWALSLIGLRWLSARGGGDRDGSASAQAVVAGNVLVFLLCAPAAFPIHGARLADWLIVGFLGVLQIGVAYALVTSAMRHIGSLEASFLLLAEPVLNPIWAWIVHGERPGGWALLGGALVLASSAARNAVRARELRRRRSHP